MAQDPDSDEASEQWLRTRPRYAFPVERDGRLVGTVSFEEVADRSAASRIDEAMVPFADPPLIDADEPLDDVVEWVRGTTLTDYQRRLPPALYPEFLARYRALLGARLPDARPYFFTFQRILLWGMA